MRVGRKFAFDTLVFQASDQLGLGGFVSVRRLLLINERRAISLLLFDDDFMSGEQSNATVAEPQSNLAILDRSAWSKPGVRRSLMT